MKNVELALPVNEWSTLKSKYAPDIKKVLVDEFTRGTINIDTQTDGSLRKRKGGILYNPIELDNPLKDQYEAIFSDGVRHLLAVQSGEIKYSTGDRIFNTVQNGTGFSQGGNFEFELNTDRVYGGNAINQPIVYDRTEQYGGVTYTVPRVKFMGAQPPSSAPTAGTPTAGGSVPDGAHTYKVTFVYYDNQESNGSPSSGVQTAGAGNNTIPLTNIPIGGYGVTARKIYRDDNDGDYVLITTLTNNTATTYSDTNAGGTTPIPLDNGLPPVFGLIALWLDANFVAQVPGNPSVVFYSGAGTPDIFPGLNFVICNQKDPITALIVYQDKLIIFNRRSLGQILGRTPDTFSYSHIPGSVGCIDNRTIQIRTIDGVPNLVWLSDRGFYAYNGNSIAYISDEIEDQVNLNIQQASQQKGSHTDDTETDFEAGTSSNGIQLEYILDAITTKGYVDGTSTPGNNPRRNWDDTGDWNGGSQASNLALSAGDNLLKPIKRLNLANNLPGTRTGDMDTPLSSVRLTTFADFTGISQSGNLPYISGSSTKIAQRIDAPARAGFITSVTIDAGTILAGSPANTNQFRITVWSNSGGLPGAILAQSGILTATAIHPSTSSFVFSTSVAVLAGQTVFIGIERAGVTPYRAFFTSHQFSNPYSTNQLDFVGSSWITNTRGAGYKFTFNQTAVAKNGLYVSDIYDTKSVNATTVNLTTLGTYPATFPTKTYSLIIEASNDGLFFLSIFSTSVRSNLTNQVISLSGQRYFRIRISMATNDDRSTDSVTTVRLDYLNNVEWISEAIDASADVTAYTSFTNTSAANGGSLTFLVATSDDNISYTSFVAFGSIVTKRYIKIKVILTMSGDNVPTVSSIILKWTLTSTFISAVIDTGVTPPAGWDVFASSFLENGGNVEFEMRSSSTLVDLFASGQVTVVDYTMLSGAVLTVNGTALTEGIEWTAATSNNATADSLAAAIDALAPVTAANPPAAVITVIAAVAGSAGNAITLATSDAVNLTISGATLTGGADALENTTFFAVTPGDFPPTDVVPLQYTQWKVIIDSADLQVPVIDNVTITWFISIVASIRCASIFVDRRYFIAAARNGASVNDIMFELDAEGKWRVHEGLEVATMSYFFNDPYYGSSNSGFVFKFLQGFLDDNTDNILIDIRTKAFDFSDKYQDVSDLFKTVYEVILIGIGTGAAYTVEYSTDNGLTFITIPYEQGMTEFESPADGTRFSEIFRVSYEYGAVVSGKTLMIRVTTDDEFDIAIHNIKVRALVRNSY